MRVAAQAQGFVKVPRLPRSCSYIGIVSFRVEFQTALLHFGICDDAERLPRSSLLREVSWKTLVLEAWILTFGESFVEDACFGSLDCHF